MHLTIPQDMALWSVLITGPICIWVALSDLRQMRIPNLAVLALVAAFAVLGPIFLPGNWLWIGAAQGIGVLLIGFLLSSLGLVGAGDSKFAAAMALFVAPGDAVGMLLIFAAALVLGFATHRALGAAFGDALVNWQSWQDRRLFPMGIALSAALVTYLVLGLSRPG